MLVTATGNIAQVPLNPKYPIYKIQYYDTPYGVPSKGYKFKHYNDPDQTSAYDFDASDLVHEGKDNILAYDWGFGGPAGVNNVSYFKSQFYGWFYAEYEGVYTFRIIKEPNDYAEFHIKREITGSISDPSNIGSYASTGINHVVASDWGTTHSGLEIVETTINITATHTNKWHPWTLIYAQREKGSYVALQYLEPDGYVNSEGRASDNDSEGVWHSESVSHYKVMSAGITNFEPTWSNGSDAAFIDPIVIDSITSVNYSKNSNQSNSINFSVPYLKNATNTSGYKGYRKVGNGLFYDDNTASYLRHGRLIEYYVGYSTSGTTPQDSDYIKKFEGVITDIQVDESFDTQTITVACQDLLYLATKAINRNYPNVLSYPLFGYTTSSGYNAPNGYTRPTAYDAWPLDDAVRDLLLKARIDPTKLYERQLYIDRNGSTATGNYLIDNNGINLKRQIRYGNPYGIATDPNSDDKYIWSFNFGDYIYDNITKITSTYGYILEAKPEGIYSNALESYRTYTAVSGWGSTGTWTKNIDIKADGGTYITCLDSGATATGLMNGSRFRINFVRPYTNALAENKDWSLPLREFPNANYDVGNNANTNGGLGQNYKFGSLFGFYPQGQRDLVWYDEITYVGTTIYIRPLVDFDITSLEYYYDPDFPYIYNPPDGTIDLTADIYFGAISEPNYQDLVTSSLVMEGYRRPNRTSGKKHVITLDTPASVTSGTVYGFRFIPKKNDGTAPSGYLGIITEPLTYDIQNCTIPITDGTAYMAMSLDTYNYPHPSNEDTSNDLISSTFVVDSGNNYGVFANINFLGVPKVGCNVNIYGRDSIGAYPLATSYTLNLNYYDPTKTGYRYPSDGPDRTGFNPCVFEIYGQDISNNIVDNYNSSYGNYIIEIEDISEVVSGTRISSIEAIDNDIYNPTFSFNEQDNITNLGYGSTIDDVRNDIVVVGASLGAFRDYNTQEIINVNNPEYQYIYSRAVDLSSINDPDSLNNVGYESPFIIYEPSIVDQDHADWLAQAILFRYNKYNQIPQWQTFGVPFLEPLDLAIVSPLESKLQWIDSVSETVELDNYTATFTSTPFAPWSAYQPKANPSLSDFGNNPFINIKMTDTNDYIRGYANQERPRYDVYESEISGVRLRVKYDQVIDGDITVKVMSKNILGVENEQPVAYLVGRFENGVETPEYREWGTDYELVWDGVDQLGQARRMLGQYVSEITESGGLITIDDYDYISDYRAPGFYAPSGEYFLRFTIYPRSNANNRQTLDTLGLDSNYNDTIYDRLGLPGRKRYDQTWQISWGALPEIRMSVSGAHALASGGADRSLTYYPNNVFYDNENDGSGVLLNYEIPNNVAPTRLLYYSVSVDHIWGVGHTFALRTDGTEDWEANYRKATQGNYAMRLGSAEYALSGGYVSGDWYGAAGIGEAIWTDGLRQRIRTSETITGWSEGNQPLELPSTYKIDNGTVYAWNEQPYITYEIADYIGTTAHRYNNANPISFYYNPEAVLGGGWNFAQVPDMSESTYNQFRRQFALAAFYAGPDNQVKIMTSHAFQLRTYIWDGTGRLLRSDLQNIAKTSEEHSHEILLHDGYTTDSGFKYLVTPTHSHNSDDQKAILRSTSNAFKPIGQIGQVWDMTVTGLTNEIADSGFNFGIGYCNIKGSASYGAYTWHGWWKHSSYTSDLINVQIPFANWAEPYAKHWCRYPLPTESGVGEKLFYACPHFGAAHDTNNGSYPSHDLYWYNTWIQSTLIDPEYANIEVGLENLSEQHTHLPIYEGLDDSSDPYGLLEYGSDSDRLGIILQQTTQPFNTESDHITLKVFRDLWFNASYHPPGTDLIESGRLPYLKQTSSFPKIWYTLDLDFPYDSTPGSDAYWINFLIESGFTFYKGGYADLLPDTSA